MRRKASYQSADRLRVDPSMDNPLTQASSRDDENAEQDVKFEDSLMTRPEDESRIVAVSSSFILPLFLLVIFSFFACLLSSFRLAGHGRCF